METRIQIVAVLVTGGLFVFVLELVRRRHLMERYALLWLFSAAILLVLAAWKGLHDDVGARAGLAPPARPAGRRPPALRGDRFHRTAHRLQGIPREALDLREQALDRPLGHLLGEHEAPLLTAVLEIGRPVLPAPRAVPGNRETALLHAFAAFDLRQRLSGALHGAQDYDGAPGLTRPFPGPEAGVNLTLV